MLKKIILCLLIILLCSCTKAAENATNDIIVVPPLLQTQSSTRVSVLRLATPFASTHPIAKAADFFAQQVESSTEGRVVVENYHGVAAKTKADYYNIIQNKSFDFSFVDSSVFVDKYPFYSMLGLPFLFLDSDEIYSFYDSDLGAETLQKLSQDIKPLAFMLSGSGDIISKNSQITLPIDFKDKTIIAQTQDFETLKFLSAQNILFSENLLPTAIQDANAMIISPYDAVNSELSKEFQYFSKTGLNFKTSVFIASKTTLAALSAEDTDVIFAAVKESAAIARLYYEEEEKAAYATIRENYTTANLDTKEELVRFFNLFYEQDKTALQYKELITKVREAKK